MTILDDAATGDLTHLQQAVGRWHRDRYPTASGRDVALKLAEEAGEVCRAILEGYHPSLHRPSVTSLADELGDVVIAAAALASRADIRLDDAVWNRWTTVRERNRNA